mgnify:CR=1 FL=1
MEGSAVKVTRVAIEKGMVKDSPDLKTRTTVQMALMFGMMAFHSHVARNTGLDPLTAGGIAQLTPSLLEIFSGLFEEQFLTMYQETYRQGAEGLAAGGS